MPMSTKSDCQGCLMADGFLPEYFVCFNFFLHVFWPRSAVCATRLVRICKFDWLVTSQPASVDRESMRRDTRKTRKKSSFKTGTFLNSTWCRKQAVTQVIDGATTTRQKCFLRLVRLQIFLLFCIFVRLPAFFVLFCFFLCFASSLAILII